MNASVISSMRTTAMRPHRSHRTLRMTSSLWFASSAMLVLGEAGTYLLLRFAWPTLTNFVNAVVAPAGAAPSVVADRFIGIAANIAAPQIPEFAISTTLWIGGICAALLVLVSLIPNSRTPLRYWITANILVLLITALFAFFIGRVGYDGASFMLLVERTSLLMVLCAPFFGALVSALLPFSIFERAALLVLMVVVDIAFALVRLAAFAAIVAHFGAMAEANLFLFFGPLMDVVYFIMVYSIVLVALGKRLSRDTEAWTWL